MRHVTKNGIEFIAKYEGFSPKIYICPAGYETIGYGHLITIENKKSLLNGISQKDALLLLEKDIQNAECSVLRLINVPLSDNQFDAIVSFTFNLGGGALQRSSLRRKINREEHEQVPSEFKKWVFAGGRKIQGLVKRRDAEANLYTL